MGHYPGEPIKGILNSSDASSGVEVPIYNQGSYAARTLGPNEYIEIHNVKVISVPGGDVRVFTGADSTPGTGEDVVRGTFGANGGIAEDVKHTGKAGHKVYVEAPAGVVDVVFEGTIRQENTGGNEPSWRAGA